MIHISKFQAKNPFFQRFVDSYLGNIDHDADGYVRHPIDGQVGIDPNIRLSTVIASFILEVQEIIVTDEQKGETQINDAVLNWFEANSEKNHQWNPKNTV